MLLDVHANTLMVITTSHLLKFLGTLQQFTESHILAGTATQVICNKNSSGLVLSYLLYFILSL